MAERIDDKENKPKKRGATRHCCYGLCNSDSRYKDREYMEGVSWIPFPKPQKDFDKCRRWARACGRENFTHEKVTKWTYICNKHFVDPNGPTELNPDPIPATFTPVQVCKLNRKRKPPTPRTTPVSKRQLIDASEGLLALQDVILPTSSASPQDIEQENGEILIETGSCKTTVDAGTSTEHLSNSTGTQTNFVCKDHLVSKINSVINKNSSDSVNRPVFEDIFSFESVSTDMKKFKFYTGLTVLQFTHLFDCFGKEPEELNYWRGSRTTLHLSKNIERKLNAINQMFLTFLKLRQAFPNQDLAYRFGISVSTVSKIINTWIQYIFKKTEGLRKRQFPSKLMIKQNLPACFASFKNVRIIIDCFEIYTQSPQNFAEQGNMYSSYKNHTTFKALVGISPSGGVSFVSDTFEGSISDREIVIQSNLAHLLEPGDLVIADRGFLIKDILQDYQAELNIPPFLNNREKLTPQEEVLTKRIARVRIHVERAIERMKKFKIIGKTLPLCLKPVVSQIVHIIGFLVNYQDPLVN